MSQATATLRARQGSTAAQPRFLNTLSSEWVKLRTLRSTWVVTGVAALLVIGLSALITWAAYGAPAHHGRRVVTDPVAIIQSGWFFGLLTFSVLGVLIMTNEYSSGMIASTFLATPKRLRVLTAKVAVSVAAICAAAEVISFINFLVGHAVLSAFPNYHDPALGDNNVLRAVLGMGLDAGLAGLMGIGLGTLFRNAAAAISVTVGITFVAPILIAILPSSIGNPLDEYWPTQAASQLEEVSRQPHALSAWWGTGDFVAFLLVLLVLAGYALAKRDA